MAKMRVSRIGVSVPPELLREFDETIKRVGYKDRSKAIHVAMRNLIGDYEWMREAEGVGVGAIVMLYDHTVRGLEDVLTDAQHDYRTIVNSTMHIHLDERNCLEIIAVKGEFKRIKDLTKELTKKRGIKQLKLTVVHA